MERLLDVYALQQTFGKEFDINESVYGRILADEDNYFEGIVSDYNDKENFLEFGDFNEKRVNLYKVVKGDEISPIVFKCKLENGQFFGYYGTEIRRVDYKLGQSKVKIQDSDIIRTVTYHEMSRLRDEVEIAKENLGEVTKKLMKNAKRRAIKDKKKKVLIRQQFVAKSE